MPRQGRHALVLSLLAFAVAVGASSGTSAAPTSTGAGDGDTSTALPELPPAAPPLPYSSLPYVPYSSESSSESPSKAATGASEEHQTVPGMSDAAAAAALAGNGIPLVALQAYRNAERRLARDLPGCGLTWSLLAAIGRVESNHGRFAGAQLLADGRSDPPILGVALDGTANFAHVGDTDGGSLDGDTSFDHAVGPMQFIPSTWRMFAVDGDGDHVADPYDIDDAALAAGDYLCAAGRNLRTEAGLHAAVLSYNHSEDYVRLVLDLKAEYERGVSVDSLPVGKPTGGKLPTPPKGPLPPVNPAPPPAADPHPTSTTPPAQTTSAAPSTTSPPPPTTSAPPTTTDAPTTTPPPPTTTSPTPTPTCPTSPTPTPSPSPSPTPSPTPDPCDTSTPTPTPTLASTDTTSPTPTPTLASTDTTSPTPTPTLTPSPT